MFSHEVGNKQIFAILGYLVPVLFFLPLLDERLKKDSFARFHANQQFILLLLFVALTFAVNTFMVVITLFLYLAQLMNGLLIGLALYGAYTAYKGERRQLPLIGHLRIL